MFAEPPLLWLINTVIDLYLFILLAYVILSLLISFGIVNRYQPFVQQVNVFLSRMTEPLLARIRKRLPPMGGIDISVLIMLIFLQFVKYCINYFWLKYLI